MRSFIKHILAEKWHILVLFLLGAILRLYRIEDFATFLGDQGRDAIIALRIITFENFPAIGAPSSIGQIFLGPFYYYLIAPFLLLTNFNPVGLSIGVALLSIIGTIAAYYVIKKEINPTVALIFLVLISFSYPLIELARFSWNPNLLPFFSFFTLFFFYKLLKNPSYIWAILFGSFLSFSTQLHHLAFLLVIPISLTGVLHYVKERKPKIIQQLKYLVLSIGSFVFFYAPFILFELTHSFLNVQNFIKFLNEKGVTGDSEYIIRLGETVQGFFRNLFKVEIQILFAYVLLLLFTISLYFIHKKIRNNYFILIHLINFYTFLLMFAVLSSARHQHYYGTVYVSFFVGLAYAIYEYAKKKPVLKFVLPAIVLLAFFSINARNYYYFHAEGNRQINIARDMANSFKGKITAEKFQMVSIPPTDTDGHIRYFLAIQGHPALPYDSLEQPEELFVICFKPDCVVIGDPQWQIASFENKKIQQEWKTENVTIYKLIHGPRE